MQSTAFEAQHPIALRGQSGIVRGHHGGQAVLAVHLAQQGMQGIGGRLVKIAGRFVGQQEGGPRDKRARHGDPLLLAA